MHELRISLLKTFTTLLAPHKKLTALTSEFPTTTGSPSWRGTTSRIKMKRMPGRSLSRYMDKHCGAYFLSEEPWGPRKHSQYLIHQQAHF